MDLSLPGRDFDLPGRDINRGRGLRALQDDWRTLNPTFGDRITPIDDLQRQIRRPLPDDTMVLKSPDRKMDVVVHCPLRGTPMTRKMMEAVRLDKLALQTMIDQQAPLGIGPEDWQVVVRSIYTALEKANLVDDQLVVKVGGSSTHGFSSRDTAMRKKRMPTNIEVLFEGIEKALQHKGEYNYSTAQIQLAKSAKLLREITGELGLHQPQAPWWGIMHRLGLEGRPDIDIQIYSPKIDKAMLDSREIGHLVRGGRKADLWNRWPSVAVHHEYEALDFLHDEIGHRFRIDLEYLAGDPGRKPPNCFLLSY